MKHENARRESKEITEPKDKMLASTTLGKHNISVILVDNIKCL